MRFGVRECADVVLRAKTTQKIGKKIFYKHEPVCYFDTLKTSTMEGAGTTVYAQGGRGNARLMSWDGERTVTFTMEDALISPIGLSILTGAGLIEAGEKDSKGNIKKVIQHITEIATVESDGSIKLDKTPYTDATGEDFIYVMKLDGNHEIDSEPFIYEVKTGVGNEKTIILSNRQYSNKNVVGVAPAVDGGIYGVYGETQPASGEDVLVDYYTEHASGAIEITITPDKFGGTFYLEASTLWKDQATGKDLPAEFIIPKCRVQSNFTFTMSGSGDPSTFTFTMDAFPDYTRFGKEKCFADIQVIGGSEQGETEYKRPTTKSKYTVNDDEKVAMATGATQELNTVIAAAAEYYKDIKSENNDNQTFILPVISNYDSAHASSALQEVNIPGEPGVQFTYNAEKKTITINYTAPIEGDVTKVIKIGNTASIVDLKYHTPG